MKPKFSAADMAEHQARTLGAFSSASEEEASARAAFGAEDDVFSRSDRMIHNARSRLTAEAKQTYTTIKAKFGLGSQEK
jgi:hypothetical protein